MKGKYTFFFKTKHTPEDLKSEINFFFFFKFSDSHQKGQIRLENLLNLTHYHPHLRTPVLVEKLMLCLIIVFVFYF